MTNKPEIIIIQESVIGSIIKDTFTFAMFAGLMYFNHKYLAGSTFIDVLFIVCVILWLSSKKSSSVFKGTKKEAFEKLRSEIDEHNKN